MVKINSEPVRGFRDYDGEEALKRAVIMEIVKGAFERYGFEPAETPVIESEEFVRGENDKDEAVSDTYKLKDKGDRKLALRYEFTFQLKRLMNNKKLPYKRFQIGPVFRDEPVKGNRTRQFITCEADVVGSTIKDEADLLSTISEILRKLKVPNVIYVNNRKLLNEILEEQKVKEKDKEQVIREIDKLDKLPKKEVAENLKEFGAEKILNIIGKEVKYFEKYESYKEVKELINYCKIYGVKIIFAPFLARGLSYYNGTVFEIKTKKIKETVCGGGAYNFNNTQCVGFGVSIERLSAVAELKIELEKYLVVSLNKDKETIVLAQKIREKGKNVSIYYGKPSKALEYANAYKIRNIVFVGEKEISSGKIKVKDLNTGKESIFIF